MADAQNPASARTAVFLGITPGTQAEDAAKKFLMVSLETENGRIEQTALTHDDGHLMLSELVQALAQQGCAMALIMHQVMEDFYDEDDEEGEESTEGDSDEGEDGDVNAEDIVDEDLSIPEDDYGPDA